ncbi:MAG: glycosyltransferase family 4 protein [Verrucomicrobiota bacterium]
MAANGVLKAFVSGYPRNGNEAHPTELVPFIKRADHLQFVYLASLRLRLPLSVQLGLADKSKRWIDRCSYSAAKDADIFLCYSGAGLGTMRKLKKQVSPTKCVVEAVNTHVGVQQQMLIEEYRKIGYAKPLFSAVETERRLEEYSMADAILCPSQFVKDSFVAEGFAAESIHVVNYGFTPKDFADVTKAVETDTFNLLYVGQIHVRKGLHYLIKAFEAIDHPQKKLRLVGPLTEEPGIDIDSLPAGVELVGVLKGNDLKQAYRDADVFVQPSIEEGLSLVIAEALCEGCPVIATTNTGADEIIEDGKGGWIVPPQDPSAIATRLQLLADDSDRLRQAREDARLAAQAIGGWNRTESQLMHVLNKIAGN